MLSLTVNTSSSLGSLVLGSDGRVLGELEWHKEKSHSEKITVMLEHVLSQSQKKLEDLELLICGYGPGSFTGLRVGLSVVKSLSYALNIPIIAVDDCQALAMNVPKIDSTQSICTLIDAQKNKVFAGLYSQNKGQLSTLLSPALLDFAQLQKILKDPSYICIGDGYTSYNSFFSPDLKEKLIRLPQNLDEPRAKNIFEYVSQFSSQFKTLNWSELSALYLRASAAEEVLAEKLSNKK